MGSSTVSLWQQAVKLLGDGIQTPADGIEALVAKLQGLPPPPKAVWKRLVQQLQVRTPHTHSGDTAGASQKQQTFSWRGYEVLHRPKGLDHLTTL
jgi:hypothetical protein